MSFIRAEPDGFRTEYSPHRGTESRTTCLYNVYIVTPALVLYGGGGGKGAAAGGDYIEFILIVVKRGYIQSALLPQK